MKILFITHDTNRTGAPMVLLHFLRWLQEHQPDVLVDVLALTGGAMENDFKAACHSFYSHKEANKRKPLSLVERVLLKLKLYRPKDASKQFITTIAENGYDIVYANTVVSIPTGVDIKNVSTKSILIAHVHELNAVISMLLPNIKNYQGAIDHYIVPSLLVKDSLLNNWNIKKELVTVVYECALVDTVHSDVSEQRQQKHFIVGASGLVHWRKGADVFVQLARTILHKYPDINIEFVWVGRIPDKEKIIINEDLRKLGLSDCVSFLGEVEDTVKYYRDFDVFVMTSREDPFPLVCIEVGLLGKPIISFDKAVGTNEILKDAGGFIVPYLDVIAMAEKIVMYYKDPELTATHGKHNKKAFSQFTPEKICPVLYGQIQTTLAK